MLPKYLETIGSMKSNYERPVITLQLNVDKKIYRSTFYKKLNILTLR